MWCKTCDMLSLKLKRKSEGSGSKPLIGDRKVSLPTIAHCRRELVRRSLDFTLTFIINIWGLTSIDEWSESAKGARFSR